MSKPTIAELEAILEEKDVKIEILPNGEVFVKDKTDELKAENARLRATLEKYADESNWDTPDMIWIGDDDPIKLAQAATRPAESEGECDDM